MTESQLDRTLGFIEALTLGGGTMIGAGIFILPGIAAEGAGPASSISFAIAGFVALLAALSLAELATGMPISGGSYHYVNRGLGSFFGSIVGWGMWTGLMFASAFYMVGFGQYIVESLPFLDGRPLIVLVGLLGLILIVGMNYYGTEESSGAQNLMIGAELVVVLVYVGLGLFFIEVANLSDFAPSGPTGIVATTGTVFVTFLGFEIIATVAGEIKEPGRLIPLTMVLSVVSVTLLYVVVMLVSTGVIPYQELGGSLVPVADVAVVYMGGIGVVAIVFAAVIAAISSSNSSILAASRVIFAMGRDNLMTGWMNATHDRFDTPHRAILTTGAVTALLVGLGLEVEAIVALLAEVASFSFLIAYGLVHVALVVYRRVNPPDYDPAFEIPGILYPAVPVLGVVMSVFVIVQMELIVQYVGLGIVALGAAWYVAYGRSRTVEDGLLRDAIRTSEPSYRVLVPVANPDTQRDLLRLGAASARANADGGEPELIAVNVLRVAQRSPRENIEADRLDHQRELLDATRDIANEMDISVQTRALVGQDVGDRILEEIEDEDIDHAVLGWQGSFARSEFTYGPNLDPVLVNAPIDVTLVHVRNTPFDDTVALIGDSPNAETVARRAAEFASAYDDIPTLMNVQQTANVRSEPTDATSSESDAIQRGQELLERVADRAELDAGEYDAEVRLGTDVESGLLDVIGDTDLVCLGLTDRSTLRDDPSNSIAERLHSEVSCNLAIVSGVDSIPHSAEPEKVTVPAQAADE